MTTHSDDGLPIIRGLYAAPNQDEELTSDLGYRASALADTLHVLEKQVRAGASPAYLAARLSLAAEHADELAAITEALRTLVAEGRTEPHGGAQ